MIGRPYLLGRRRWQAIVAALALIPTATSILELAVGIERFVDIDDVHAALDSAHRYLGCVYLAEPSFSAASAASCRSPTSARRAPTPGSC